MPPETMIGVDTNVILRAVLRDDPQQSVIAARLFRELTPSRRGFITQVTLDGRDTFCTPESLREGEGSGGEDAEAAAHDGSS